MTNFSEGFLTKLAETLIRDIPNDEDAMTIACLKGFASGFDYGIKDFLDVYSISMDNLKTYVTIQAAEIQRLKMEKKAMELRLAELLAKFN